MTTRRSAVRLALALALVLAAGCAVNRPDGAASGPSADPANAVLDLGVGVDPAYAPIYLADQQRLFARAGVDVKVTQYPDATGGLDAILAKTGTFAAGTEASLLNRSTRGDLKAIAVFSQSPTFIKLVVRPGVADVGGIRRYGIVKGSVSEYVTNRVLASRGIDRQTVEFVNASPPELPALLTRGDIDGYIIWEPWPARGLAAGGRILLTSGDVGYVYNQVIAVDGAWFERHRDLATRVVRAVAASCDRITADPSQTGQATERAIKVPAAEATALLDGVQCQVRDFTDEDIARYQDIAQFQLDNKIVSTRPDPTTAMIRGVA